MIEVLTIFGNEDCAQLSCECSVSVEVISKARNRSQELKVPRENGEATYDLPVTNHVFLANMKGQEHGLWKTTI